MLFLLAFCSYKYLSGVLFLAFRKILCPFLVYKLIYNIPFATKNFFEETTRGVPAGPKKPSGAWRGDSKLIFLKTSFCIFVIVAD